MWRTEVSNGIERGKPFSMWIGPVEAIMFTPLKEKGIGCDRCATQFRDFGQPIKGEAEWRCAITNGEGGERDADNYCEDCTTKCFFYMLEHAPITRVTQDGKEVPGDPDPEEVLRALMEAASRIPGVRVVQTRVRAGQDPLEVIRQHPSMLDLPSVGSDVALDN